MHTHAHTHAYTRTQIHKQVVWHGFSCALIEQGYDEVCGINNLDHFGVGVVSFGFVRLVDHDARHAIDVHHPSLQVVLEGLRGAVEQPVRFPQLLALRERHATLHKARRLGVGAKKRARVSVRLV